MATLVLDVGSSSVRALVLDDKLEIVATARQPYQFTHEPEGAAEVDAVWLRDQLERCIDEVLPQATITAVGMATFVGNMMGVDADNTPITPIFTYADSRAAREIEQLAAQIDIQAVYERTGCPHHTAYHPAKLRWVKCTQPKQYEDVDVWMDFGTYCYQTWFGRPVPCSYSVASWSGMLDRIGLIWDASWLDVLGLELDDLPELADYDSVQTGLAQEYAERWPQLADVPFYLAVGDGAAANIGSGGVDQQKLVLTIGTTAALRMVTTEPPSPLPPGLWSYRVDQKRHLVGGATTEGGNVFGWAQDTLNLDNSHKMEVEPDAHGLTVLPMLAGERSPGFAPNATGTITGIRLSTTPEDILLALLESIAFRLGMIADLFAAPDLDVYAGGGSLLASPVWGQIIANAMNRSLHLVDEPEVTARGVAQLMNGEREPAIRSLIEPQADVVEVYAEARKRQQKLYRQFYGKAE